MANEDKIHKKIFGLTAFGFSLPTDHNVKENEDSLKITAAIEKELGFPGAMLYGSKTTGFDVATKKGFQYIPNGNIFVSGGYKVWFGDIMTDKKTTTSLKLLSAELGVTFYILRESDGRFLSTPPDDKYLEEKFKVKIHNDEVSVKQNA